MAGTTGGFTEELICSVCLETYDHPVMLPCAHSFCRQCLVNIMERSRIRSLGRRTPGVDGPGTAAGYGPGTAAGYGPGTTTGDGAGLLMCPQCRKEVTLGPAGVGGLPKNTSLANIILSVEDDRKSAATLCEVCELEPARAAFKACVDCGVVYCLACFRQCHPMRGAFKFHVIKEANDRARRMTSPVLRSRTISPSRDGYNTDGAESGDEGGGAVSHDEFEDLRKKIRSKRKELTTTAAAAARMLKTTEEETEERMREVRATCSTINEKLCEREAAMLNIVSTQRHEAVRECIALTNDVKALTSDLDLVDDQLNDLVALTATHHDVTNDIQELKKRLQGLNSRPLHDRARHIPRQPKMADHDVITSVMGLEFVTDKKLVSPVLTEVVLRPVREGPALVQVKWRGMVGVMAYRLCAKHKEGNDAHVTTFVTLSGSVTSYTLALPRSDADYDVTLTATSAQGDHPQACRAVRTLPYVHCTRARFSSTACHKRVAVSSSRDEIQHRKCKLANTHGACSVTSSPKKLEQCEGASVDEPLPLLPHVYWEATVYLKVYGKLGDSKLLCDIGVCKTGSEDDTAILCDNPKSYCAFLARRKNKISMEFWNGPNRDTPSRSISIMDLDKESEKTIKLGFYFDALRRQFGIVSPGNNSVLMQFPVKFASLAPQCGLYSPEHVHVVVKLTEPLKLPNVLNKLMK